MSRYYSNSAYFTQLSYGRRITLMLLLFFVALISASVLIQSISSMLPASTRDNLLTCSAVQNLVMFILPAFATALFVSTQPISLLGLNRSIRWRAVLGILLIYIAALPALNQIIYWNNELHFPSWFHEMETMMRNMEDAAAQTTQTLLNTTSWMGLLNGILVIGILTGISEELFFRGTLQRVIGSNGMNHHLVIWISAIVFSILHFQFFGFVPRVLLGAFFGYLFYWTGSIWCAALAHAINNSVVVISSFLENRGYAVSEIENFGVTELGFPIWAAISAVITVVIIITTRKYFFASK